MEKYQKKLKVFLKSLGVFDITIDHKNIRFDYNDLPISLNFDEKLGYSIHIVYKSEGNAVVVKIGETIFKGFDAFKSLKALDGLVSSALFEIIENLFIANTDKTCKTEMNFTCIIGSGHFTVTYILNQNGNENYPKTFSVMASGVSGTLKGSIIIVAVDELTKVIDYTNCDIYTEYFKYEFGNDLSKEIDFSGCTNIIQVFEVVYSLKQLKHMLDI